MSANGRRDRGDKSSGCARAIAGILAVLVLVLGVASSRVAADTTVVAAPAASAESFEFALIGDYPYFPRGYAGMPHLLQDLREARSLSFVLHLGDLHNPRFTACSEALYLERRDWFLGLGIPFILTPGDNDWADCADDRLGNLQLLRRVFYADPSRANGEGVLELRSQGGGQEFPEVVENAIWERGRVVFATLHMIAPRMLPWPDETAETRAELIAAAGSWLDEVFRVAQQTDARGVFLATQVSLWGVSGNPQMLDLMNPDLLGVSPVFVDFERKLIDHVRAFGGPVVLANGDSHYFRIDKPLVDEHLETIQTFTRVEGFGSPHGHWVRVRIDADRPEVFQFRQELVPENLYTLIPRDLRQDGFEPDDLAGVKIVVRVFQLIPKLLAIVGACALVYLALARIRRRAGRGGA